MRTALTFCVIVIVAAAWLVGGAVLAQPPAAPGERGAGPPPHPLLLLLDENKDGELSAVEIENAVEVLKKLDANGDGRLTMSELPRPAFPGPRGPGGPGGPPNREQFIARMRALDKDGNGKISREETPERMIPLFERADADGDGCLDEKELMELASRFGGPGGPRRGTGRPGGEADRGSGRLMGLDADGNGKISKDELPAPMQPQFSRIDTNGDGFLDREELRQMATRFGPGGPGRPGAEAGRGDVAKRILNMDADGDGQVTKDEVPERMQGLFDRIDTNADGVLDEEELKVVAERLRAGGGARRKPDDAP
jgi:collagen type III alpha